MDKKATQSSSDERTIWALAEDLAERAIREMEVCTNEYQAAEAAGQKHEKSCRAEICNAGDLCGG